MTFQPFALRTETYRVELPEGHWVDIAGRMSQYDQDRYMSGLMKFQTNLGKLGEGKPVGDVEFVLPEINLLLLGINITDWSFTDGEKKVPVDRERLERLTNDVAEPVLSAIMERNPKLFGQVEGKTKKTKSGHTS